MNSSFKRFQQKFIEIVAPKHEVPITRWTADGLWDLSWLRALLLTIGIILLGVGGSFTVQSNLGTAPWTVLAQGISVQTGLPLGVSFFLVSLTLFLMWIPLSLKPGYGTIANTIFFKNSSAELMIPDESLTPHIGICDATELEIVTTVAGML